MRSNPLIPPLGVVLLLLLGACDEPAGTPSPADTPEERAEPSADVIALVNGRPIREADLHFVLRRADRGRARGADAAAARAALEKIIDEELARQKAEAMGLDRDPEYRRRLHFMEAPLKDFQRYALSEAFTRKEILAKAKPSEKEARAFFEENRARFATRFRVQQIQVRGDEARLQGLKDRLDAGESFDAVAATLFPTGLEPGQRPWTLEGLPWSKLPEPWRESLETLKEGQISEILRGPKERAWIIKLLERQIDPSVTFEIARSEVLSFLAASRTEALVRETTERLRREASVSYLREPGEMPPPPEPED